MSDTIRADQFRRLVVRPVLEGLEMWSSVAERLVLGTACVESELAYIEQIGGGPALGFWQIEPATEDDLWDRYFERRRDIAQKVQEFCAYEHSDTELATNLRYGCALCRVIYWRRPEALPAVDDDLGLGRYWKAHYNTALGAGTPEKFVQALERFGV